VFNAQGFNALLAVLIFYLVPYFSIAPKTNLFLYLILSFIFLTLWRFYGHSIFAPSKKERAFIIGAGEEMRELFAEVNNNPRYGLYFVSSIDINKMEGINLQDEVISRIYAEDVSVIVVDIQNENTEPLLPHLYNLLFSEIRFMDMHRVYEDIFDRIPLSLVHYNWFLENISGTFHRTHDFMKRMMDIVLSIILGGLSLVLYPFVALAIYLEDGRPIFFRQERVGQNSKPISIIKFRSMKVIRDESVSGDELRITKVGKRLRKARIDELPQLWNVLKGDLSLIGPRPELPAIAKRYEEEVPYYNVRYLVKPGLSGWAQLYHDEPAKFLKVDRTSTKVKLSYDLYYLKNRSFMLDLKIALKTAKVFFMTAGK
jgi:exopolysaccharide biosynthesis polyprenyl glycosylphosphotransferase